MAKAGHNHKKPQEEIQLPALAGPMTPLKWPKFVE